MKRYGWIAVTVAVLDQAIKACVRTIPVGQTFFEIPGLFSLIHCVNTGAAFSLLSGNTVLLAVLSVVLLAALSFFAFGRMHLTAKARVALACLLGGGVGNLLDRVLQDGVTDYIRLLVIDFPVFNLADMAITGSIFVLLIFVFTDTLEESSEGNDGSDD